MKVAKVIKRSAIALLVLFFILVVVVILAVRSFVQPDFSKIGHVKDEALLAVNEEGDPAPRLAASFTASQAPHFIKMDKGLLKPGHAQGAKIIAGLANALEIPEEEVRTRALKGQNSWIVWTGGNDRFWDQMARRYTFGAFDLLKTLSSHESLAYGRYNRWSYLGVVNEPCFKQADGPDEYGLWLDKQVIDVANGCPEDPFANETDYPGVQIGARGKNVPVGSFYGKPTGVVGLRLFPNPDFDAAAQEKWDAERFYNDPDYYKDKDLIRPYRVGMSCAFCHVGPSPVNPPKDPENPHWENLASNPGAQYYWVNRIFFWDTRPRHAKKPGVPAANEHNFIYQLFHTNPPGTLDTSLVSTDYMNNPRTMNAVYSIAPRLGPSTRWGTEQLSEDDLDNKQFNDYPQTKKLGGFWNASSGKVQTPRVLKDGADSVGVLGALNRVYLNIGLFSEEWLEHFYPVVGGQKIVPIKITDAQKNSSYWNATEEQTADMAIFFLATATPDDLKDAPGGKKFLSANEKQLQQGKIVFAENCAACHSSKIPPAPAQSGIDTGICADGGNGPNYLTCWNRYWAWAQTDEFKTKMTALVLDDTRLPGCDKSAFLCDNYLSTERRVPVDLLQTNTCSPIATNALDGDIWDNFSSTSYKQLPAVGELTVHHPVSGGARSFQPLGNGRGYTRPASLISLWSTAPFLVNNSLGHLDYYDGKQNNIESHYAQTLGKSYGAKQYASIGSYQGTSNYDSSGAYRTDSSNKSGAGYSYYAYGNIYGGLNPYDPGVANRMAVFTDSINKLLNPTLRRKDLVTTNPVPGYMYRTTANSCVHVAKKFLPDIYQTFSGALHWFAPWAVNEKGDIEVGPFPEGMPVNLIVNTQLITDNDEDGGWEHLKKLGKLGWEFSGVLKDLGGKCDVEYLRSNEAKEHAKEVFYNSNLVNELLNNSKCPDYVANRGHYFGTELSQQDKTALIEYLKTF